MIKEFNNYLYENNIEMDIGLQAHYLAYYLLKANRCAYVTLHIIDNTEFYPVINFSADHYLDLLGVETHRKAIMSSACVVKADDYLRFIGDRYKLNTREFKKATNHFLKSVDLVLQILYTNGAYEELPIRTLRIVSKDRVEITVYPSYVFVEKNGYILSPNVKGFNINVNIQRKKSLEV